MDDDLKKQIARLRRRIESKRRRGENYDTEAAELAVLQSDLQTATGVYRPGWISRTRHIACKGGL